MCLSFCFVVFIAKTTAIHTNKVYNVKPYENAPQQLDNQGENQKPESRYGSYYKSHDFHAVQENRINFNSENKQGCKSLFDLKTKIVFSVMYCISLSFQHDMHITVDNIIIQVSKTVVKYSIIISLNNKYITSILIIMLYHFTKLLTLLYFF